MEQCYNFDRMVERNPYNFTRNGLEASPLLTNVLYDIMEQLKAGEIDSYSYCGWYTALSIKHESDIFFTVVKTFTYNGIKMSLPTERIHRLEDMTASVARWIK